MPIGLECPPYLRQDWIDLLRLHGQDHNVGLLDSDPVVGLNGISTRSHVVEQVDTASSEHNVSRRVCSRIDESLGYGDPDVSGTNDGKTGSRQVSAPITAVTRPG